MRPRRITARILLVRLYLFCSVFWPVRVSQCEESRIRHRNFLQVEKQKNAKKSVFIHHLSVFYKKTFFYLTARFPFYLPSFYLISFWSLIFNYSKYNSKYWASLPLLKPNSMWKKNRENYTFVLNWIWQNYKKRQFVHYISKAYLTIILSWNSF